MEKVEVLDGERFGKMKVDGESYRKMLDGDMQQRKGDGVGDGYIDC